MKAAEQLISDYYISPAPGGMIHARPARRLTPAEAEEIRARKPEILAVFAAREAARKARQAAIAAIPGLEILRSAMTAAENSRAVFLASFEDEDGCARRPTPPTGNIRALAAQYPAAALWLRAEDYLCASHHAKFVAGKKAQELILEGDFSGAKETLDGWTDGLPPID